MVPTIAQINHDLGMLYTIARTLLSKEILEALLYGEDFDEPKEEDIENIRQLVEANRGRVRRQPIQTLAIETETAAEGLWKEEEYEDQYGLQ